MRGSTKLGEGNGGPSPHEGNRGAARRIAGIHSGLKNLAIYRPLSPDSQREPLLLLRLTGDA